VQRAPRQRQRLAVGWSRQRPERRNSPRDGRRCIPRHGGRGWYRRHAHCGRVRGHVAWRGLGHGVRRGIGFRDRRRRVYGRMLCRPDGVCVQRRRHSEMRRSDERMHAVGDDVDLRSPPNLHGRQRSLVHVHIIDLRADRHGVPERADARNLRDRREQLRLRRVHLDVPESPVVLRHAPERGVLGDVCQ
jgi:hypothetical protein